MFVPIRRWRAAGVGVVFVLTVASSAAHVSAGVVAPPESDPLSAAESSHSSAAGDVADDALPLATGAGAEPFWFPGVDVGEPAGSLSSVPIRSTVDDRHSTAFPGTQQHPLIPLPGAAWTGMAGLLGLGAVKVLRNIRRLLA